VLSPDTFDSPFEPLTRRMPAAFRADGRRPAVLGVGALTHDTSAALVCSQTGNVLYASPEERLSNVKHDSRFPIGSILQCCRLAESRGFFVASVAVNFDPELYLPGVIADELSACGVDARQIGTFVAGLRDIALRGKPLDVAMDSECRTRVFELMRGLAQLDEPGRLALALRLTWYLNVAVKYRNLAKLVEALFEGVPVRFVPHHDAHAASAYFGSGFPHAAILVVDGHGELDTTTIHRGEDSRLTRVSSTPWPNSVGAVFLATTRYLGFEYGDEYKVMGMSAYGTPRYLDAFREAVSVTPEGRVHIAETPCFAIRPVRNSGQLRFSILPQFHARCAARRPAEEIRQEHFDLAASVQALIEELGVKLADVACRLAGTSRLAVAGGVGLNGLMNEAIRRSGSVSDLFVYPAASDDGTSAGAAQAVLLQSGIRPTTRMHSCYFGYPRARADVDAALKASGARYSTPPSIHQRIAEAVAEGRIVARYTGAAEFGPRALGNRSILANPAIAGMKDILNVRVKHREQFRPFAPACLREHVGDYFEIATDAPFMILIVRARDFARLRIPAVVHSDGTARVQTVSAEHHPDFHRTLEEFFRITGLPVMINTSFNVNGEAIVETPMDAIESFAFMDIDYLALGEHWISKAENPGLLQVGSHDEYLAIRRNRYGTQVTDPLSQLDVRKYEPWFYPDSAVACAFAASIGSAMQAHSS
jgi:carbamoyltransferase